jgi:hypothetical protein
MIINPYVYGVAYDPDAQAFFTAAGITDDTQKTAINTLVVTLKGFGIWTKMKAIYPMVGGTASTHKWNLKNPLDTNAAFRLVFFGGWTHSSTGALPNGTNGYANTFYNLSVNSTTTNVSAGVYNRTNILNTNRLTYGAETGSSNFAGTALGLKLADGLTYYATNDNLGNAGFGSVTDVRGFFAQNISSTNSNNKQIYRNGSLISNATRAQTAAPNLEIAFGANNRAGVIQSYDNRETAFLFLGDTLTITEVANYYTAVQAFQTTLTRNV